MINKNLTKKLMLIGILSIQLSSYAYEEALVREDLPEDVVIYRRNIDLCNDIALDPIEGRRRLEALNLEEDLNCDELITLRGHLRHKYRHNPRALEFVAIE